MHRSHPAGGAEWCQWSRARATGVEGGVRRHEVSVERRPWQPQYCREPLPAIETISAYARRMTERQPLILLAWISACSSATPAPRGARMPEQPGTQSTTQPMLEFPGGTAWCDENRGGTCTGSQVAPFLIDATPVSRADYERCVASRACTESGYEVRGTPHTPIPWQNGVTLTQATAYCAQRTLRLPLEAEWNHALLSKDDRFQPVRTTGGNEGEWIVGSYADTQLAMVLHQGASFRFGAEPRMGFAGIGFRCARSRVEVAR